MKYALFIAIPLDEGIPSVSEFVSGFQNSEARPENNKMLLPGVWELDLKNGLEDLAHLISLAKVRDLKSQVLFSESEFSWVKTPIDKK